MLSHKIIVIDKIIKIGLFPIVFIQSLLPSDVATLVSPSCLFTMLFDVECFGCGMGRALQALSQLEWQRAIAFNMLSPLVLLLLVVLFIFGLKDLSRQNTFP